MGLHENIQGVCTDRKKKKTAKRMVGSHREENAGLELKSRDAPTFRYWRK